jgi:hypothetical protein
LFHASHLARSLVRYLLLILSLLVACAAPPTHDQSTSRAIRRNCEAQGAAAAGDVRQQSVQVIKEGSATNQNRNSDIEAAALSAQRKTFKSCMLKYAV